MELATETMLPISDFSTVNKFMLRVYILTYGRYVTANFTSNKQFTNQKKKKRFI